ncbi:hypothetical protein AVEN_11456-1 [Araneus ventricosus]|uniref:Uncharacterized protein n=1 Tax=Araneus ventricosus TaxID=182803 RepID=A0A4Y2TCH6_ARAVE|nr:hypothetical protein AVEN_11456-1 [Araneus ventricosus]
MACASYTPTIFHYVIFSRTWIEPQLGARSLTGEIRKSLVGCEKLPVVSSTPIENKLCEVTNKKDLSTDQLYLMEICEVINY